MQPPAATLPAPERCGVPGCDEEAERTCASCDGRRCWEHSHHDSESGESFCDLTADGHRFWRTDLNYCDKRPAPERCAGCGAVSHHDCGNCHAWTCPACAVFGRCCDAQGVPVVQR